MHALLKEIYGVGIIPVLKFQNKEFAEMTSDILVRQSLPIIEVVMRSSATFDLIRQIKSKHPEMIVGLSNVRTAEQIDEAIQLKTDFISSVYVDEALVRKCQENNILIIPECSTSVDIDHAKSLNLQCIKLLAGTQLAELKMVKELSERYKGLKFVITSGIMSSELVDYLGLDSIVACCVERNYRDKDIENFDYVQMEQEIEALMKMMLGLELGHVGINSTPDQYRGVAEEFSSLLKCGLRELPVLSIFAGNTIEVMRENGRGKNGHIAYLVNNVERAMHYYMSRGYHFVEETFKYNAQGKIVFAYFEQEIGGFAIHLSQK